MLDEFHPQQASTADQQRRIDTVMLGPAPMRRIDTWIAPASIFLLALLLFSLNLDRPPHPDELHHVLAAQRLLETGQPLIGEGEYRRGILYTWLVALSYEVFGEGLASARIPAVLLVALVGPILFLWIRREAGPMAAWIAAVLFITSPFTVEIAQFSRFYALQIFFFTLGSVCAFYAMAIAASLWRRALLGALAIVLLALATWQQETSLMGLVGVAVWIFGALAQRAFPGPITGQSTRKGLVIVLIVVGIFAILAMTLADALEWAWQRYRSGPLFSADAADEFWYYHVRFLLLYPTLWPLAGLSAVFAVVRSPRLAWFAVSVFGISLFLTSFAAQKATRYLSFAQPFLAIVWGIGLAYALPAIWRHTQTMRMKLTETLALPQRLSSVAGRTLVVAAIAIVVLMNPFWLRTAALIGNVALPFETPTTDWRAARETLAPWVTDADIMITTEELGAIYFLGRSDVRFSPSKLGEIPVNQRFEFGIDHRTGRPIITKPESLEKLIQCFQRGIIVGPIEHWGNPILISNAVQAVLRRHAKPIEVPEGSHLYAWGWAREVQVANPSDCSELRRFSGVRGMP